MDTFGSFQPGAITNIKFLTIAALQFLFRSIASNCLHNQIYHSCVPRNCTRSYGNTDLFVFKEFDHSSDIPDGQDQVCVSDLSLHLGIVLSRNSILTTILIRQPSVRKYSMSSLRLIHIFKSTSLCKAAMSESKNMFARESMLDRLFQHSCVGFPLVPNDDHIL